MWQKKQDRTNRTNRNKRHINNINENRIKTSDRFDEFESVIWFFYLFTSIFIYNSIYDIADLSIWEIFKKTVYFFPFFIMFSKNVEEFLYKFPFTRWEKWFSKK